MFGVRTPWTLTSGLAWDSTHRLVGRRSWPAGHDVPRVADQAHRTPRWPCCSPFVLGLGRGRRSCTRTRSGSRIRTAGRQEAPRDDPRAQRVRPGPDRAADPGGAHPDRPDAARRVRPPSRGPARPRREQADVGPDHRVRQPDRADPVLPRRPRGGSGRRHPGTRSDARLGQPARSAAGRTPAARRPGPAQTPAPEPPRAAAPLPDAPPAIVVERLVRRYPGGVLALDGLDLAVPTGSVFGLLGPNGAGKTTCLRLLAGLTRATAGRALVTGLDPCRRPDRRPSPARLPRAGSRAPTAG